MEEVRPDSISEFLNIEFNIIQFKILNYSILNRIKYSNIYVDVFLSLTSDQLQSELSNFVGCKEPRCTSMSLWPRHRQL